MNIICLSTTIICQNNDKMLAMHYIRIHIPVATGPTAISNSEQVTQLLLWSTVGIGGTFCTDDSLKHYNKYTSINRLNL